MKRVTASDARRDWFRLLDEVARGEVVVIDRNGRQIRIQRVAEDARDASIPDYRGIVRAPDGADEAERWGWAWDESGDLVPVDPDPS